MATTGNKTINAKLVSFLSLDLKPSFCSLRYIFFLLLVFCVLGLLWMLNSDLGLDELWIMHDFYVNYYMGLAYFYKIFL